MTIRVLSFDFDGCLFHAGYIHSSDKDVIRTNQAFLDKIKEENKNYSKIVTFVGSNRQSKRLDVINSYQNKTGSCFPAIKTISDHLNATLDPFLLADIFDDLKDGESYDHAMDERYNGDYHQHPFDPTKIVLLYAQINKAATTYRDEEIVFDFYDNDKKILEVLKKFFEEHLTLVPHNITLRLNFYDGGTSSNFASIKSEGFINDGFRKTVEVMATGIGDPKKVKEPCAEPCATTPTPLTP